MGRMTDMLMHIGKIGINEDGSITRLGFSDAYNQAVEIVKKYMDALDMITEIDSVFNVHGILLGTDPNAQSILLGSHMDSVLKGGIFDGPLGIASALEIVCRLKELNMTLRHPIEIWGFNMEESSILGGTFGSRSMLGLLDAHAPGYDQKLAHYGKTPKDVYNAKKDISKFACYLECHIEQGDKLDRAGLDIGVVSGLVGIIRYKVTAHGMSNHAGTTMMPDRKDALVGMSKLIVAAEQRAQEIDDTLVFTVGILSVSPGQENIIPNEVTACFEMRHLNMAITDRFYDEIKELAKEISNCEFTFERTVAKKAAPCDPFLMKTIEQVCTVSNISHVAMPSGATHDGTSMAQAGIPIGMIFVPSVGGVSHQGGEWTEPHHVELSADVLFHTVLELDQKLP